MNKHSKTTELQTLGVARRNFFQAASVISLGSALSAITPTATAQTTDRFVLVTVQLNLKPGKVEPLSKEVLENEIRNTHSHRRKLRKHFPHRVQRRRPTRKFWLKRFWLRRFDFYWEGGD